MMHRFQLGKRTLRSSAALAAAALFFVAAARRRRRRIPLEGCVALITGGGRGLGLAITRALVQQGCRVAICGRDEDVIAASVATLREAGADAMGEACDASDPVAVNAFVQRVLGHFGRLDILVNNAGQCFVGPAAELQAADMERALRNIFWVHYHPTMAVLPHMRAQGFGRIANITSIGGKLPIPHQVAYVAGKYAATGWSQTLALELSREGIRVSTITPPPLKNGAPLHVHYNGQLDGEFRWFARTLTSRWTAISAQRTASVVVDALRHGDAERAVAPSTWLFTRLFGALPNAFSRLLAAVERRLPAAAAPGVTSRMHLGALVVARSEDERVHALGAAAEADEARYLPVVSRS
jgi:NAD(P)-dependent dehydrogenase (short-subunit alcohol dehydrogenase family)